MDTLNRQALNLFFQQQEQPALKMSIAIIKQRDDALEIVQDSMLKLVQHYAHKPSTEWTLLFYRILHNKIRDHHRKQSFRNLFQVFQSNNNEDDEAIEHPELKQLSPDDQLQQSNHLNTILKALNHLPLRQKQTFVMRAWQELSVKETAFTLNISQGSVKTHYSRALAQLRNLLGEQYDHT